MMVIMIMMDVYVGGGDDNDAISDSDGTDIISVAISRLTAYHYS